MCAYLNDCLFECFSLELDTLSSEETVHGLKHELERCLEMYRNKRQLVNDLQRDLKDVKVTLEETKQRLENAQKEASESKVSVKVKVILKFSFYYEVN